MSALKVTRRLILVLAVVGVVGCSPAGIAEQTIKRELPEAIGPADNYEVDIEGLKASTGEADRIVIIGQRVRPQGAPVLEELTIELRGIQYNRRAQQLERLSAADATAQITAMDLADFLETQPNIQAATVTLLPPDQAVIRVRPTISLVGFELPVGITVDTTGNFVGDGDQIQFMIADVRAAGATLGNQPAQLLSQSINPLVDLSNLPIDVQVTAITVENNSLKIQLTASPIGL